MSSSKNQDVTPAESHTFGLLTLFQFLRGNSLTWFKPLDATQAGDVEQNSATDDTMSINGDVVGIWPTSGNAGSGLAVIETTLVCYVTQSVDVGVTVTVDLTGEIVEGKTRFAEDRAIIKRLSHVMRDRVRIVRAGDIIDRNRHGNGSPRSNQRSCISYTVCGDVVESATFVVVAPHAPVADALEQGVELMC